MTDNEVLRLLKAAIIEYGVAGTMTINEDVEEAGGKFLLAVTDISTRGEKAKKLELVPAA